VSVEPNLLKVDAFKRVIDAIAEWDALYLADYGTIPELLTDAEADILADYAIERATQNEPELNEPERCLAGVALFTEPQDHLRMIYRSVLRRMTGERGAPGGES
jgi:hypothetical protein